MERDRLHAWLKAWDRAAKELDRPVLFFTYLLDEPNDEKAYREVQQWGRAVREAKSALKVMVVEQTKTQDPAWGDLYGAVDIWCPLFPLHDPRPPPSGWPWASRSGPTRPCARASRRRRGGTSTIRS